MLAQPNERKKKFYVYCVIDFERVIYLFMSSLARLERSYYAVGSRSTKPGIFDYLFEHRPCYARGSAGMCAALKEGNPLYSNY